MSSPADPSVPPAAAVSATATPEAATPRDAAFWAAQAGSLRVSGTVPSRAINLNVDGKSAVGPLQGFGQMWQKTYVVRLNGVDVEPTQVISAWKVHFAKFWPRRNYFYGPLTGIAPGEVALLNIAVGGMPLSTGVLVLYADDESFTFMTPQGHVFAGWITFSSYGDSDGVTVAQVQVLMRANDPIYEMGLRFGGHAAEDRFWRHTLTAVARYFGMTSAPVALRRVCVDRHIQWRYTRNIWHNAAVRTTFYLVTSPLRWTGRLFGRRPQTKSE
jgi:hypothetical protein